ncbi:MAG: PEP-CTERM-box response regulator transcription factor [Pseudomonadota bacterium]
MLEGDDMETVPVPVSSSNLKEKLLIVEDDPSVAKQLKWALADSYEILLAHDGEEAMALFDAARPEVITLDLGLPPDPNDSTVGLQVLERLLAIDPTIKVIIITGNADRHSALNAVALGAYDYYQKPIDVIELKVILRRAFHIRRLEQENLALQRKLAAAGRLENIVGSSRQMQEVFAMVRRLANSDVPVLIEGESGTGKELVSRAVHSLSLRREKPFIVINCGAIPENLLEAELFGHEKGAFTGAHIQRRGRIEFAAAGTLFLDEIGELGVSLQVKLLRFLQEQTIERVGGRQEIHVDARVIAATNKDLKQAVAGGSFREDLYYRLSVVSIRLAPLRERSEDILLLAKHFLASQPRGGGERPKQLGLDAIDAMLAHNWPGNARELENRIRRALIMADGLIITPANLDLAAASTDSRCLTLKDARERAEAEVVRQALVRNNNNITHAAAEMGVSRPTLHDLIKKHGFRAEDR